MGTELKILNKYDVNKPALLCLPGNLLSPLVFKKLNNLIDIQLVEISWLTSSVGGDIRNVVKIFSKFIEEKKFPKLYIAGHSAGGVIALLTAITIPIKIDGLIISNTGANMNYYPEKDTPDEILTKWGEDFRRAFVNRSFKIPIEKEIMNKLYKYAEQCDKESVYAASKSLREIDLIGHLHRIKCPTVLAHGKLDTVRSIQHAKELNEHITNSELHLVHAGHTPMLENPKEWAAACYKLGEMTKEVF